MWEELKGWGLGGEDIFAKLWHDSFTVSALVSEGG
jgi:hypothetical protein